MSNVNSILDQRMKKPSNTSKMAALAKQSSTGNLTSFSGIFNIADLSEKEKEIIGEILKNYANGKHDIHSDLNLLISLTSEVKAINNQAALLHGERIKKAHQILTHYREGAFTAWLVATYGNRQTPYNLMQYYEFCEAMPKQLRSQIELMPRQAVYVLASRSGSLEQKQAIVENYQGETKAEMLTLIRQIFPLNQKDKRQQKMDKILIQGLQQIYKQLKEVPHQLTSNQKHHVLNLLKQIHQLIGTS
jgi:translation initiation factor 2 beta subunit (eIF-2beta)/eIF-5